MPSNNTALLYVDLEERLNTYMGQYMSEADFTTIFNDVDISWSEPLKTGFDLPFYITELIIIAFYDHPVKANGLVINRIVNFQCPMGGPPLTNSL